MIAMIDQGHMTKEMTVIDLLSTMMSDSLSCCSKHDFGCENGKYKHYFFFRIVPFSFNVSGHKDTCILLTC